jgi:hypothetical protein
MAWLSQKLALIERTMAHDVGRGSEALARYSRGGLEAAINSIISTPHPRVVILTGFFIPAAEPPAAETDGPIGAIQIAAAINALGGSVRLLTDEPCESAIRTSLAETSVPARIDVAPLPARASDSAYQQWETSLFSQYNEGGAAITHFISIERCGPNFAGRPCNMRGDDLSAYTAPLHQIYESGSWKKIAIGDGGNEIGMGCIPSDAISRIVKYGEKIRCVVGCDCLLIGGTSNWAAAGLVAGLGLASPAVTAQAIDLLDPEWSRMTLQHLVFEGPAVDGMSRVQNVSVDGLEWEKYASVLSELRSVAMEP